MITYSHYRPADAHQCVELWNSALGDDFPLDVRLWRQNVDHSSRMLAEASIIARDDENPGVGIVGLTVVKAPRHIGAIVVRPEYQRQGIGTEMMAMAEQTLGADTPGNWVVGQDYNHFFPGVPAEAVGALAFFENRLGFTPGEGYAYDLRRNLADYAIAPDVQARIKELADHEGIELRQCESRDLSKMIDFIAANFSHRWVADTITRLNVETTPAEVAIARRTGSGEIVGFAHTFSFNSRYAGPSVYWRALLGPKYGGLGPMGIDQRLRGQGLGLALLSYAVQTVKDRGVEQMAIDWTELTGFYAKCGFEPWKRYVPMRRK